jgi:hypothetical protein
MTPATATAATWAAPPRAGPAAFGVGLMDAPAPVALGCVRVVEGAEGAVGWKLVVLLGTVTTARCSVRVLVMVTVLVEVVVTSCATAASGKRRAVKIVGRCIFAAGEADPCSRIA